MTEPRIITPEEAEDLAGVTVGVALRNVDRLIYTVATEPKRRDMAYDAGVDDGYAQAVTDYADLTRAAIVKALREVARQQLDEGCPADSRIATDRADAIANGADLFAGDDEGAA